MSKIVAGIIVAAGLAAPAMAQSTVSGSAPWDVDVRILADGDPSSPYTGSGVEVLPGVTAGTFRIGLVLQARANVATGIFNGGIGRLFGIGAATAGRPVVFSHNAGAGSRLIAGDIGAAFNTIVVNDPILGNINTGGTGFETAAGGAAGVSGSIFRGGLVTGQNFGVTNADGFIVGNPAIGVAATLGQFNAIGGLATVNTTASVADFGGSSPFQSIFRFVFETTNLSLSEAQIDFQGLFSRIVGVAAGAGSLAPGGAVVTDAGIAAGTDPFLNTPIANSPASSNNRFGAANIVIAIPTPGAAALLGLGGLVAARRRR